MSRSRSTESYQINQTPFVSFPIRVPGITMSVHCSVPTFQITLKGGNDMATFERNQTPNLWRISSVNYARGCLAYDIILGNTLHTSHNMDDVITISITYSTLIPLCFSDELYSSQPHQSKLQMLMKELTISVDPKRWVRLPNSRSHVKSINVQLVNALEHKVNPCRLDGLKIDMDGGGRGGGGGGGGEEPTQGEPLIDSTSIDRELKIDSEFKVDSEFKIAIASIPLKILDAQSVNGTFEMAHVRNSTAISDSRLNFSNIFGAWIIFNRDVDWEIYSLIITYTTDDG